MKEKVHRYLDIFFNNHEFDAFRQFMLPGLRFRGPLYRSDKLDDYISALKNDPPTDCRYELRHITHENDRVVVYYDFIRQNRKIIMAQYFHFDAGMIDEITLVFDREDFAAK